MAVGAALERGVCVLTGQQGPGPGAGVAQGGWRAHGQRDEPEGPRYRTDS